MPPPIINEADVDFDAQIHEIQRLVSTTNDPERRLALEEQLRELELAHVQHEHTKEDLVSTHRQRRKSFRPVSAKPRVTLSTLAEDKEVTISSASSRELDAYRGESVSTDLIADVLSSSYDEGHAPTNVLICDSRTFWMTSGMYPQLLRLTLREPTALAVLEVTFRYVRKMQIRSAQSRRNPRQAAIGEVEFPAADSNKLSSHHFTLRSEERTEVIEIAIESGYNEFAIVYFVRMRLADDREGQI